MRRLPKKGEVSGGVYTPEAAALSQTAGRGGKDYGIRDFPEDLLEEIPAEASFNQKIDAFYRREGGALSLDSLREEARRKYEKSIDRVTSSLERLREKEADFSGAERLKEYGDIILSNLARVKLGDEWLETENFEGETVRIKLKAKLSPAACAEEYYEQYRKAKSGITELRVEIADEERELTRLQETLASLVSQTNPLVLHKLLKGGGTLAGGKAQARKEDAKRPGLSFRRGNWLLIVGRDASENDALLRRHVKGNDLWLHARDYAGSYVFIKQQSGKTVPLDILLDAGNLAIFYSKGRNSGKGDLFYTQVKYLRRAKDGPKGLVIPTQEKNLHVKLEPERLRELEDCRVAK
jgi:predicted ribosome quality control (RQC) complex YloA/Tae2 family protein